MFLGVLENPIKVSIDQLHGIEINDFAVSVAKTALWIAEAQMYEETRALVSINEEFLPLHSNSNMIEGNALQMDWNTVCNKNQLTYIIGNPPLFLPITAPGPTYKFFPAFSGCTTIWLCDKRRPPSISP